MKKSFKGYNPNFYKDKEKDLQDLKEKFMSGKSLQEIVSLKYKTLGNNYSFYNNINAMYQCEAYGIEFTGTMKGFKQWEKIGVNVIAEQKKNKLYILIPVFKYYNKDNKPVFVKKGQDTTGLTKRLSYFSVGYIFDISQTDSPDYTQYKTDIYDKIHYHTEMESIIKFSLALEFVKANFDQEIEIDKSADDPKHLPSGLGCWNRSTRKITLHKKFSHTLLHEFSHDLQRDTLATLPKDKQSYAQNEVIAEISTFLIANTIYPDIEYNFNYSKCWSNNIDLDYSEFEKLFKVINTKVENLDYKVYQV